MKIFITGYANSGTTLFRRLFYAFEDLQVIDGQTSLSVFCNRQRYMKRHIVAKRDGKDIFSGRLPQKDVAGQLALIKRHNINIVNIIRDGRDAILSVRPLNLSMKNWNTAINQYFKYKNIISVNVRYEDLVRNHDAVQMRLAKVLGLKMKHKFSHFPSFVPNRVRPSGSATGPTKLRPIDCKSVGKVRVAFGKYIQLPKVKKLYRTIPESTQFRRNLVRLGYIKG